MRQLHLTMLDLAGHAMKRARQSGYRLGSASKNGGDAKLDSAASFDEECGQRDAANQTNENRKTHRLKRGKIMTVNYRPLTRMALT